MLIVVALIVVKNRKPTYNPPNLFGTIWGIFGGIWEERYLGGTWEEISGNNPGKIL